MSDNVWFFTFGIGDPMNAGCYVRVPAASREEARTRVIARYGTKWAFQYDTPEEAGVETYGLVEIPFP